MSQLLCDICGKEFTDKRSRTYHVSHRVCEKKEYECSYCGSKFTTKTAMYRHIRSSCKIKKREDDRRDNIYERLLNLESNNSMLMEENEKLKKKVEKMECGKNMVTNNNVNYGNIQYNINNINLVAHGKEDLSKIDKNELLKVFRSGFNSTFKLTETMHFNPEYPEFHNVYISSMKNKYAMMYDGSDWTLVMKDDLIDRLYDDKRNYIEENSDDFFQLLTVSQKKALHRWMDADDDHPYIGKIKNDMKLLLYNKRKYALSSRNKKPKLSAKSKDSDDSDDSNDASNITKNVMDLDNTLNDQEHKVIKTPKTVNTTDAIDNTIKRIARRPGTKRKILKGRARVKRAS